VNNRCGNCGGTNTYPLPQRRILRNKVKKIFCRDCRYTTDVE